MRNIEKTASITLTYSQWNMLFIALYDAESYCNRNDMPSTGRDIGALRTLIQNQGGLDRATREAFAADFPELRVDQAMTDEAIAKTDEVEITHSVLHGDE
jgi:hypothetical protein